MSDDAKPMVKEPGGDELTLEIENNIAVITLNWPDVGNALSATLLTRLADTLNKLKAKKTAR